MVWPPSCGGLPKGGSPDAEPIALAAGEVFLGFQALRVGDASSCVSPLLSFSVRRRRLPLRYSLTFLLLAAAFVVVAIAAWHSVGWAIVLPLYAALSFALLAAAYAGVGPQLLLKRATGRRSVFAWLLFAPYFMLNALTFVLYRLLSHEPAFVQVAPNLFFGRRLSARETDVVGWVSILDLAAEFPAARVPSKYRSLPVLDGAAPTEEELRSAVEWVAAAVGSGVVYIHCALGHGRSACVVIAYLLFVGTVRAAEEGEQLLRSLRPGVRLHPPQLRLLRRFEPPESESTPLVSSRT